MDTNTASEMKRRSSTQVKWLFKGWRDHHVMLTAQDKKEVTIENLKFRFILLPFEETAKVDKRPPVTRKSYSLCMDVLNQQEPCSLEISTKTYVNAASSDQLYHKTYQIPLGITNINNNSVLTDTGNSNRYLVDQDFLPMKGRQPGCQSNQLQCYEKAYQLEIEISTTVWHLVKVQSTPSLGVSSDDSTDEAAANNMRILLNSGLENKHEEVTIKLKDNKTVSALKDILISASGYFKSKLGKENHAENKLLDLTDINLETMKTVLEFIYLGKRHINLQTCLANIVDVITAAKLLELNGLLEYCDEIMMTACNPENALKLFNLTKQYEMRSVAKLRKYVEKHAFKILQTKDDML